MRILVFGGTGFVGLNIAQALLARGLAVTLFDRARLPPAAQEAFAEYADRLTSVQGDVTDRQAIEDVIARGFEAIVLAAAITAGPEREAAEPESILRVNLLAQTAILTAARIPVLVLRLEPSVMVSAMQDGNHAAVHASAATRACNSWRRARIRVP